MKVIVPDDQVSSWVLIPLLCPHLVLCRVSFTVDAMVLLADLSLMHVCLTQNFHSLVGNYHTIKSCLTSQPHNQVSHLSA